MILIHGVLTLTSPLHTSAGSKGMRLQRDGRVSHKDTEGIPIISTVTMPLTVRGRYYGDLPIFPASGIVGKHRRFAARRVRAALGSDTKKLPVSVYYAFSNGHAAGPQLGGVATLREYEEVKSDLFFGLFGGGSMRNAASFIQCDLVPVIAQTIDAGLVPQKFADLAPATQRGIEPWQLVDYRVMRKFDDVLRGRDAAEDVALEHDDTKRESAAAYQVINPGTSLYWRAQLAESTTAEQRGLFLLALKDLCDAQQLGGRTHLGWGAFTAQRFRYVHGKDRFDLFDMAADDEGVPMLTPTPDYVKLVKPAEKQLAAIAKSPADMREQVRKLLNA